jgi:hypothetical protein
MSGVVYTTFVSMHWWAAVPHQVEGVPSTVFWFVLTMSPPPPCFLIIFIELTSSLILLGSDQTRHLLESGLYFGPHLTQSPGPACEVVELKPLSVRECNKPHHLLCTLEQHGYPVAWGGVLHVCAMH